MPSCGRLIKKRRPSFWTKFLVANGAFATVEGALRLMTS